MVRFIFNPLQFLHHIAAHDETHFPYYRRMLNGKALSKLNTCKKSSRKCVNGGKKRKSLR